MAGTFVVFGSTGAQGGSVLDAAFKDTEFKLRAVTRDSKSEKAQALAAKYGDRLEFVEADVNEPETLDAAFAGAKFAFAVTNFWDPTSMGREYEQGQALVAAAKKAGVEHFIWSTLPNAQEESKGKYHVPHFSDKGRVNQLILDAGFKHSTFVAVSFYYQNVLPSGMMGPRENNGKKYFMLPELGDKPIAMYDVTQTGAVVVAALHKPDEFNGQYVAVVGDELTPQQLVATFNEVLGDEFAGNYVKPEDYESLGFPGAKELGDMFAWFRDFGYHGAQPTDSGKKLAPLVSLKTFLEGQKKQ